MSAYTRLPIARGTLEVSARGDFWEVNLNLGRALPLELLGVFDDQAEAEWWVAETCRTGTTPAPCSHCGHSTYRHQDLADCSACCDA